MNGAVAASTATPTLHLGTYRRAILRLVVGNELFTAAEQLRCNDSVHQCEDSQKLALWLKNVRRVAAEREALAELPTAPLVRYATAAQKHKLHQLALHPALASGERTQLLLKLPRLTEAQATAAIAELQARLAGRGPATNAQRTRLRKLVAGDATLTPREREDRLLDASSSQLTRRTAAYLLTAWLPLPVSDAHAHAAAVRYDVPGELQYLRYFQN